MKPWFRALPLALTVLVAGSEAFAQPLPQIRTVYNPAPKEGQEFGFPLAVYGEDLLVALAWSDGEVQQHGKLLQIDLRSGAALRTFDRPRGPSAKTKGKDPANSAVTAALNVEDKVLVGMPYDDAGSKKFAGAVHEFNSHDGALLRTLTVPPKAWNRTLEARDSRFGASLALASSGALVGAPGLQHPAPQGAKKPLQRAGGAFLFDLQTGALLQAFAKDNPRADDRFGASVAGGRGMALVAAPGDAGGAVYAFNPGDAALIRAFRRTDGKPNDGFGHALCVVGDRLLVGAPGESSLRPGAGAVYVFDLGTGTMERMLRPATQKADDFFGYSLAAAGTRALIGAHGIDRGAGAVFVVDPAGPDILATLRAPRPVPESGFGMSVAVLGDKAAISAHREPFGEEGAAVGTGVVYLVPLPAATSQQVPATPTIGAAREGSAGRTLTFDTDRADAAPAGFSFGRTGGGKVGRWVVRAEADAPSPPHVLQQLDADDTDNRFAVAVLDGTSLRDLRLSVRCKPVSGRVDQACGLVFRYRDENNYLITRANSLENNIRLYYVKDGNRRQIANWSGAVTAGVWHAYEVEVRGDHIQVSWDGKKVLDHHDATFLEAGRVGVWTKADSVTYFDDLRVEPLP